MRPDLFDHLSPIPRMAGKIIDRLEFWGGQMTKRTLERRMNANKHPLWKDAWAMLLAKGYIHVTGTPGQKQIVTLIESPRSLWPRKVIKKAKSKRRGKPTEWFKRKLPEFLERDGYSEKAAEAAKALESYDEEDYYPRRRLLYVPGDPLAEGRPENG